MSVRALRCDMVAREVLAGMWEVWEVWEVWEAGGSGRRVGRAPSGQERRGTTSLHQESSWGGARTLGTSALLVMVV